MATFNYAQYEQQQAARKAASNNGGSNLPKVHFMGEFLKADGDFVIVRFPYSHVNDFIFESVHKVVGVFPGDRFGKMVRCTGDSTCPLCNHEDENVRKRIIRFYSKMVVYANTDKGVEMLPTVWDRPAMFADTELKALIAEYGDLTDWLFKITRSGSGTATRYIPVPVNMNSPVYSGDAYKKDLSCLENIDPVKILSKSIEQYNEVVNPTETTVAPTQASVATVQPMVNPQTTAVNNFIPTEAEVTMVKVEPVQQPVVQQPTITPTQTSTGRYRF